MLLIVSHLGFWSSGTARSHEATAPLIKITASLGGKHNIRGVRRPPCILPPEPPALLFFIYHKALFYPPALPPSSSPVSKRWSHRTNHLPHFLFLTSDNQHVSTSSEVSRMNLIILSFCRWGGVFVWMLSPAVAQRVKRQWVTASEHNCCGLLWFAAHEAFIYVF